MSEWRADVEKATAILEKKLKNDSDLNARLDAELFKCDSMKEKELAKEAEKIKRHR